MPISVLDAKTAKLITTTQIITSVYAVVKELMENALDADADNIEINLVDNGTSLIEVKDNGCGISKEDAPYMGLPSYTSKISNFEDLDLLQTFGFRGEALGAICAMAEVTIVTKINEGIVGTSYTMDHNGQIIKQESCHRGTGTTVQVRNLFKQIPVRRQMIINTKNANQAIKLLEMLTQSFGICKPNVRIQFRVNNNIVFTKPSLNNIQEAANHVFGRKIVSNMEWIEPRDTDFVLKLLVPSKKVQDLSEISHHSLQFIFVNNRPIKHKDLEKVVSNVIFEYFGQETHRKKVVFLVYIILEPMNIDINLEPNKDTVLFKDQNKILDTIDKYMRTFYGLNIVATTAKQDISNDTSACYEDDTLSLNEDVIAGEWPACKKRKMHIEEKIIQRIVVKEKSIPNKHNDTSAEVLEDIRQNGDDKTCDQQHYKDMLTLTSYMEAPNLSDSDSNDTFPVAILSNKNEDHESLSQLPVVDLGEDFSEEELGINNSIITYENKDGSDKTREKKQISLEEWSKGHIADLKGGTDIKSYNAIEIQSNDDLVDKTTKIPELDKTHVDNKNLMFLKHVRSQVSKENPTLTAAQAAKKITEFWKQLSSEERGYYRDIARDRERERKHQRESAEISKTDSEKNKNRLLRLFEKMKNTKNEKEMSNIRTMVSWTIDRDKIMTRSEFETGHIVGQLTSNLWVATICEQIWVVNITSLINGLKVSNVDINKIDAKTIERLLKQWLLERDDMSIMYSMYKFTKDIDTG